MTTLKLKRIITSLFIRSYYSYIVTIHTWLLFIRSYYSLFTIDTFAFQQFQSLPTDTCKIERGKYKTNKNTKMSGKLVTFISARKTILFQTFLEIIILNPVNCSELKDFKTKLARDHLLVVIDKYRFRA